MNPFRLPKNFCCGAKDRCVSKVNQCLGAKETCFGDASRRHEHQCAKDPLEGYKSGSLDQRFVNGGIQCPMAGSCGGCHEARRAGDRKCAGGIGLCSGTKSGCRNDRCADNGGRCFRPNDWWHTAPNQIHVDRRTMRDYLPGMRFGDLNNHCCNADTSCHRLAAQCPGAMSRQPGRCAGGGSPCTIANKCCGRNPFADDVCRGAGSQHFCDSRFTFQRLCAGLDNPCCGPGNQHMDAASSCFGFYNECSAPCGFLPPENGACASRNRGGISSMNAEPGFRCCDYDPAFCAGARGPRGGKQTVIKIDNQSGTITIEPPSNSHRTEVCPGNRNQCAASRGGHCPEANNSCVGTQTGFSHGMNCRGFCAATRNPETNSGPSPIIIDGGGANNCASSANGCCHFANTPTFGADNGHFAGGRCAGAEARGVHTALRDVTVLHGDDGCACCAGTNCNGAHTAIHCPQQTSFDVRDILKLKKCGGNCENGGAAEAKDKSTETNYPKCDPESETHATSVPGSKQPSRVLELAEEVKEDELQDETTGTNVKTTKEKQNGSDERVTNKNDFAKARSAEKTRYSKHVFAERGSADNAKAATKGVINDVSGIPNAARSPNINCTNGTSS